MAYIITEQILKDYIEHLIEEEKSIATIKKYTCDIRKLMTYARGKEITKKLMLNFKEDLRVKKEYKLSSINSFLVAVNKLFEYLGWYGLNVKLYRIQNDAFASKTIDISMQEYRNLVMAAWHKGKKGLP